MLFPDPSAGTKVSSRLETGMVLISFSFNIIQRSITNAMGGFWGGSEGAGALLFSFIFKIFYDFALKIVL